MADALSRPTMNAGGSLLEQRWLQLTIGVIAMMAISSPQYVWTLFVKPLQTSLNASLAAVQVTFSILIVVQTWLSPLQGYAIERFGARALFSVGGLLVGASWVLGGSIAAVLHDSFGNWAPVFYIVIGLDVLTAIAALLLLKPMRGRWLAKA